jgi:hypothetical protein
MDCFVATLLAMTVQPHCPCVVAMPPADIIGPVPLSILFEIKSEADTPSHSRGSSARGMHRARPSEEEGAGSTGRSSHPQPRVRGVESTRVSHHEYAESIRRSPRNGLRLIPRSPRSAGLDSLRRLSSTDLIPASGDQDHAASLVRASLATPSRDLHVHCILLPTFVAIGQTPLHVEAGCVDTIMKFGKTEG